MSFPFHSENESGVDGKQPTAAMATRRDKRALGDISNVVAGAVAAAAAAARSSGAAADAKLSAAAGLSSLSPALAKKTRPFDWQTRSLAAKEALAPRWLPAFSLPPTLPPPPPPSSLSSSSSSATYLDPSTVRNVEAPDIDNHLAVPQLVNHIFTHFRHCELDLMPNPNYMAAQRDINARMRAILVDWLVDVHVRFKLMPEVLYLTVNLIDRFLSECSVVRQKLQLVGVTAMLVASKYEEIYAPEVRDFVYISDKAYTREEILKMEAVMLNRLKFDLTIPSALKFVDRALRVAGAPPQQQWYAKFCVELALVEYKMLRFPPSLLAAACVNVASRVLDRGTWDATLTAYTGYAEADLLECCDELMELIRRSESSNLTAVRRKYSSSKYGEVARSSLDMLMEYDLRQ